MVIFAAFLMAERGHIPFTVFVASRDQAQKARAIWVKFAALRRRCPRPDRVTSLTLRHVAQHRLRLRAHAIG